MALPRAPPMRLASPHDHARAGPRSATRPCRATAPRRGAARGDACKAVVAARAAAGARGWVGAAVPASASAIAELPPPRCASARRSTPAARGAHRRGTAGGERVRAGAREDALVRRAALAAPRGRYYGCLLLMLAVDGRLAEGSTYNVFVGARGGARSRRRRTCACPGVSRAAVIRLAAAAGIEVRERDLMLDDALGADEVFVTSTSFTSVRSRSPTVRVGGPRRRSGGRWPPCSVTPYSMTSARTVARTAHSGAAHGPCSHPPSGAGEIRPPSLGRQDGGLPYFRQLPT